jgi:hypothetical protein
MVPLAQSLGRTYVAQRPNGSGKGRPIYASWQAVIGENAVELPKTSRSF